MVGWTGCERVVVQGPERRERKLSGRKFRMVAVRTRLVLFCVFFGCVAWGDGATDKKLLRRVICRGEKVAGTEGCVPALVVKKFRRNYPLPCVNYRAVTDGLMGMSFECARDRNSLCIDDLDEKLVEVPEWVDGPLVTSRAEVPWKEVVVVIMEADKPVQAANLEAIASTWMVRLPSQAAVVIVTDERTKIPSALEAREKISILRWTDTGDGSSSEKLHATFAHILERFPDVRHMVKVTDTTFLLPANLQRFLRSLQALNGGKPVIFGKTVCLNRAAGAEASTTGPSCYVAKTFGMNRAALDILVSRMDANCHKDDRKYLRGETSITDCLGSGDMALIDCGNFRPHSLGAYLHAYPETPERSFKIVQNSVLVKSPISFERMEPSALRFMDTFFYDGENNLLLNNDDESLHKVLHTCTVDKAPSLRMRCKV